MTLDRATGCPTRTLAAQGGFAASAAIQSAPMSQIGVALMA